MRWTPTATAFPENETVVRAISPSGDEGDFYFENGLWFLPDKSMYVYFVPTYWRPL